MLWRRYKDTSQEKQKTKKLNLGGRLFCFKQELCQIFIEVLINWLQTTNV